jgi:hypothetical protein
LVSRSVLIRPRRRLIFEKHDAVLVDAMTTVAGAEALADRIALP